VTDQRRAGPPYGQPQYGQPQYGQAQYGQPQYGQPAGPYAAAPGGPAYPPYPGLVPPARPPYLAGQAPLPPGISRASYGWVWGVAGVLALSLVAAVGLGVLLMTGGPQTYGDDPRLDALYDACERGSMRACDRLFEESPLFSEYEEFGLSCGGRTGLAMTCAGSEL
jgi:hypothetical protein